MNFRWFDQDNLYDNLTFTYDTSSDHWNTVTLSDIDMDWWSASSKVINYSGYFDVKLNPIKQETHEVSVNNIDVFFE